METQAILRGVHLSAQKGRLVADLVRGKPVEHALNILTFSPKKAARIVKKVLESAIANHELAARMQLTVPELLDLQGESDETKRLYGFESTFGPTRIYAKQCLTARRMVERGVRFIELTCPRVNGADRWDAHGGLKANHESLARAVDQPVRPGDDGATAAAAHAAAARTSLVQLSDT